MTSKIHQNHSFRRMLLMMCFSYYRSFRFPFHLIEITSNYVSNWFISETKKKLHNYHALNVLKMPIMHLTFEFIIKLCFHRLFQKHNKSPSTCNPINAVITRIFAARRIQKTRINICESYKIATLPLPLSLVKSC